MSKADQALRARALELAQGNLNSTTPTGAIIERAKAYLAFLSPAKPVKAKKRKRRRPSALRMSGTARPLVLDD